MSLRRIGCCLAPPGATRGVKWGADVVYSVGAKMFAVTIDEGAQCNVSFKADLERFLELTDRAGFVPRPSPGPRGCR